MNDFEKKIKNRVRLLATGLAIVCSVIIYLLIRQSYDDDYISSIFSTPWKTAATNIQLILLVTLIATLIFSITKNIRAIRNPDRLDNLYIYETDERNIFIKQKTGSLGMNMVMFGLTIATIVTGNSNPEIFFTLLGSLLFVIVIHVLLTVYYSRKY
ncbi:MAG: hypothetical protein FWF37_02790 [Chloroflexi bacterium]|nr:hypothetical protein [Chloroflexota bacterium]